MPRNWRKSPDLAAGSRGVAEIRVDTACAGNIDLGSIGCPDRPGCAGRLRQREWCGHRRGDVALRNLGPARTSFWSSSLQRGAVVGPRPSGISPLRTSGVIVSQCSWNIPSITPLSTLGSRCCNSTRQFALTDTSARCPGRPRHGHARPGSEGRRIPAVFGRERRGDRRNNRPTIRSHKAKFCCG